MSQKYSTERIRSIRVPGDLFGTTAALFHLLRELDRPRRPADTSAPVRQPTVRVSYGAATVSPSIRAATQAAISLGGFMRLDSDEFVFGTA